MLCQQKNPNEKGCATRPVRAKSISFSAVGFYLFFFVPVAAGAPQNDACDLPKDLQRQVANKYPGKRVVTLADLQDDDRGFFQTDHNNSCPGLVKVDFYGDGRPTLAIVLIPEGGANQNAELVIAHLIDGAWKIAALASGDPSVPVVWSLPPGKYTDVYGKKTIRATRPVIVFFQYEAWGILYAWTNHRVAKIWIAD